MTFLPVYSSPKTQSHLQRVIDLLRKNAESASAAIDGVDGSLRPTVTFGATTAVGQVVYPTTSNNVDLACADAIATARPCGIAATAGDAAESGQIIAAGFATVNNIVLITNTVYFLSAVTPGLLVSTIDATAGQFVVPMGIAVATDKLFLGIGPVVQL